ncbi:MAG: hypothetical protein ACI9OT_001975 [Gammaproteobacteria bacterium]|jgi:hypothetical protein
MLWRRSGGRNAGKINVRCLKLKSGVLPSGNKLFGSKNILNSFLELYGDIEKPIFPKQSPFLGVKIQ